ncbi:hypothetical protein Y032_0002g534 [Ancylostoma ceylanicum]|uniref:Uncharacterized protein n=1 Tax=Ancylostoma ceylanicum TaxID=53326 RepID=A0A016W1T9_9BILA|nr:hypothetical protein Y032_0002g534 [Ancylostoma ceylanicum]
MGARKVRSKRNAVEIENCIFAKVELWSIPMAWVLTSKGCIYKFIGCKWGEGIERFDTTIGRSPGFLKSYLLFGAVRRRAVLL